ncbi:MAG: class I SAM-dependent methyltransferase [Candidatus Lokiarchaeota archaeon]|nr:class I SAM-dependent methyltransferase [Candidatus Lokiarchaeota archaeon]
MSKTKNIPPRVPEGEALVEEPDFTIEELNQAFKKRIKEYTRFVDYIINDLKIKDNSKVLEIGPGPAWISIVFVKKKPLINLIGLEISDDMIQLAKENIKNEAVEKHIEIIKGDAKNMKKFEDNCFDVVITHDSLHHWEDPIMVFNEIERVLKNDGIFCIADGRRDLGLGAKLIFQIAKFVVPKNIRYYWKTSIMAGYTHKEITEILDQSNLKNKYLVKTDLFDLIIHNK